MAILQKYKWNTYTYSIIIFIHAAYHPKALISNIFWYKAYTYFDVVCHRQKVNNSSLYFFLLLLLFWKEWIWVHFQWHLYSNYYYDDTSSIICFMMMVCVREDKIELVVCKWFFSRVICLSSHNHHITEKSFDVLWKRTKKNLEVGFIVRGILYVLSIIIIIIPSMSSQVYIVYFFLCYNSQSNNKMFLFM